MIKGHFIIETHAFVEYAENDLEMTLNEAIFAFN